MTTTAETCVHHFDLEDAQGPVSLGVCRHCGEVREHHNSIIATEKPWKSNGGSLGPLNQPGPMARWGRETVYEE